MSIKKKNSLKYFVMAIFLTGYLMLIKNSNIFNPVKESFQLRNLFIDRTRTYSCDKAGSRLTDKYKGDFNEETGEAKEKLNDAEQSIVDFARDRTYDNIQPYLKRVAIYITFLCLVVIFIGLWISYCSCCCCNCCLFQASEESFKNARLIFFIISAAFSLLVIIFSIVILCLINPFFSRINGLFCSLLNLLHHLNDGLGSHYPLHNEEWQGLDGVLERFKESEENFNAIDYYNLHQLYDKTLEQCEKDGADCICDIEHIKSDQEMFEEVFENSFGNVSFSEEIDYLEGAISTFDSTGEDIDDDIYDFLHKYVNGHIKRSCIAIFVLTLIIGILGLASLGLYYFLKSEVFRIFYIAIWNISMLFMLLAIIVSVIFGVIGYVFTDGIQVIHYILSSQNLQSTDPVLFSNYNIYVSHIIEECANGDGHFLDIISEGIEAVGEVLKYYYQGRIDELNSNNCDEVTKNIMIQYYSELLNSTSQLISISSNLFNISCSFAKNDKNIILNEVESTGKRATVMSTFQFLVGIFLGLSALAGILVVHKYKYNNGNINEDKPETKNNITDNTANNTNQSIDYMEDENKKNTKNINIINN